MKTQAKRTREQAQLDDTGAERPQKIAAKTWQLSMHHLECTLAQSHTLISTWKPLVEGALLGLGMCPAAVARVTRMRADIDSLRCWPRWRKHPTRTALRMWHFTQCPKECPMASDCTWRVAPSELDRTDRPRFVAASAKAGDKTFFPFAALPDELIGHVARMLAYDFTALWALARVCGTLRRIVLGMMPTILVDCGMLVREPVPYLEWRTELHDLPAMDEMVYVGADVSPGLFRGMPLNYAAHYLLARPGKTLAALKELNANEWRTWIAKRTWGTTYDSTLIHLMTPFASDFEVEYVRTLVSESYALSHQWCNRLQTTTVLFMPRMLRSVAALRAGVSRAQQLPVVFDAVRSAIAHAVQPETMLSAAFSEPLIMAHIFEHWACKETPWSAVDMATHMTAVIEAEANAYLAELSTANVSLAFFRVSGLADSDRPYCTSTPAEICTQAHKDMSKIINRAFPLFTADTFWPDVHRALVRIQFPVGRLYGYSRGGCVGRVLLAKFVNYAWEMHQHGTGFAHCRDRLYAVWTPIERALDALCAPNTIE